ncbi:MAG: MATE family efflux transporter [Salinispira sp.]
MIMKQGIFSRIAVLGLPLLFAQIMHYLHQIADSVMLGRFGDDSFELAAVGIAGLFTWILNTMLWPLSNGVQAITARRFGKQSEDDKNSKVFTGEALDNGMLTALAAGVLALAASIFARPILSLLIQNTEILERALEYIGIMRLALIPTGLFFVMQGFFGAINKTAYVMMSGIFSNVLNILLNYLFIFGAFGIPPMGIRGAALGTVISWAASAVFLFLLIILRSYAKMYRLFTFRYIKKSLCLDIIKVALPPGVQNVIALSIFMIYQTIIEDYSVVILAATHIAFSVFRLNKTLIGGFARGAGILIGNAFGRNDKKTVWKLMTANAFIAAGIALLVALITAFGRNTIAAFFTTDPRTIEVAARALLFFAPFFLIEALGFAFEIVFVANGYGRYVLLSEFSTNIIFIIGATLLARYFFPNNVTLAWLSFGLYQIFHALLMFVGYLRKKWLYAQVESPAIAG